MVYSPLDLLCICVHATNGFLGVTGNLALLAALKFRSPKTWKSYTILLTNCAVFDLLSCLSSSLAIEIFVPFKDVTVSAYLGPCTIISGFFCHILHSFTLHSLMHSLVLIVVAFCYRLYVLGRQPPSTVQMIAFCVGIYLPTFSILVMNFLTNDPTELVRPAFKLLHPDHQQFEDYVIEGHVDAKPRPLSIFIQAYMILPIIPLIILVFCVRSKVIGKLKSKEDTMTSRTKEMHKSLVQVLTLQASLPLLFFLSVVSFVLTKRQIYVSPFLEYSMFWFISFMPSVSPYITLWNVAPFRNFVLCRAAPRLSVSVSTVTAISTKH